MLKLRYSKQFKKDFKLSQKRGLPMQKLKTILEKLVNGIPLEEKHHDHPLSGNYTSFRECHIEPDWLLIYKSTKMSLYSLLRELEHIVICLENDTCPPTWRAIFISNTYQVIQIIQNKNLFHFSPYYVHVLPITYYVHVLPISLSEPSFYGKIRP